MNYLDAMKQALEALERKSEPIVGEYNSVYMTKIVLRTAIEEMEKAEPVAWIDAHDGSLWREKSEYHNNDIPLFTHPAPIPEGWQLVPKDPTVGMIVAAHTRAVDFNENADEDASIDDMVRDEYKAMLAAAPKPEDE